MAYLIPYLYLKKGSTDLGSVRNQFFKSFRISDYEEQVGVVLVVKDFSYGRSPLHGEAGLVITPLDRLSRIREIEDSVSFHKIVKVA